MPVFAYKGVDARGKVISGAKDADSPKGLRALLRREGVIVTEVAEAKGGRVTASAGKGLNREVNVGGLFRGIKKTEIAAFTRLLGTLLKAGLPLAESLNALFEQTDNPRLKGIIGDVRIQVNEGKALAESLQRHPRTFDDQFVSMVRAGETAGNLEQVLFRLAEFLESSAQLRSKVIGALIYPAIMVGLGALIMVGMMVFVMPQITQLYRDSEQSLPWNTELLIWTSEVAVDFWWFWLPAVPAAFIGFRYWAKSDVGKPIWDRVKLKLPIFGKLTRQVAIARFSRTLSTMLSAGVALLRALDISKEVLGNYVLYKVVEGARERIQQGESIAATLKRSGEFPPVVIHMIAVGERAGQLEQMLGNVTDAYEVEVELKISWLTSLLAPVMIIFMGGAVMFMVVSILMPMLDMNVMF
jgi:general secretion pathway protein F